MMYLPTYLPSFGRQNLLRLRGFIRNILFDKTCDNLTSKIIYFVRFTSRLQILQSFFEDTKLYIKTAPRNVSHYFTIKINKIVSIFLSSSTVLAPPT